MALAAIASVAKMVSTLSRPKAAGSPSMICTGSSLFQHSAARRRLISTQLLNAILYVSTLSRPKAADHYFRTWFSQSSFNTQPPEGGCSKPALTASSKSKFQHSAARRRLAIVEVLAFDLSVVSTLSRPKAAATYPSFQVTDRRFQHSAARRRLYSRPYQRESWICFNTQPPEGGWVIDSY